MDYKEKYEQALERARQFSEKPYLEDSAGIVEYIFPELKESEDEKIRKNIITYLKQRRDRSSSIPAAIGSWIAWLEKQGEQNLAFIEKGKWYVCIRTSYKPNGKDFIEGKTYYAKEDYKIIGECGDVDIATDNPEEFFRSATEEETNDIIKNFVNEQKPVEWKQENVEELTDFENAMMHIGNSFFSANAGLDPNDTETVRSQANLLLELAHNPVEWSEEDKNGLGDALWCCKQAASIAKDENDMGNCWYAEHWLKSLKDRVQPQPKPDWSEEDEKMRTNCAACLGYHYQGGMMTRKEYEEAHNWLESLKDRVLQQQTQGWSEEDEEKINFICNIIADKRNIQKTGYKSYYNGLISWLKSLRPQKHWKPTEDNIDQAISILEKAAKDIKIPEKYKASDWLCEKEDDLIENLHRQLRDNILRAKEEAKNKI